MLKPIKGSPGRFLDTGSGQVLNISDYREDDKYDTIVIYGYELDSAGITAGKQYVFFRDVERKMPIDTNLTQPSRLSAGEEMVIDRVGTSIDTYAGEWLVTNSDFGQVVYNAHLRVEVNKLLLTEGPMVKYACGYGVTGSGLIGFGLAPSSFVNIGVPSSAAVPKLVKTQTITDKHELGGYLTFFSRAWADWNKTGTGAQIGMPEISKSSFVLVKCWLHGLLKVAVSK